MIQKHSCAIKLPVSVKKAKIRLKKSKLCKKSKKVKTMYDSVLGPAGTYKIYPIWNLPTPIDELKVGDFVKLPDKLEGKIISFDYSEFIACDIVEVKTVTGYRIYLPESCVLKTNKR